MWTQIQLKNFRGYSDTGLQELRPLTILIGPNGGGKSTLLKLFMAFKQTAESSDNATTLITSVDLDKRGYVDLGLYPDYVYQGDTKRNIQVFLGWETPKKNGRQKHLLDSDKVRALNIQLAYRQIGKQVVVQELEYRGLKQDIQASGADGETKGKILVSLSRQPRGAYKPDMPHKKEWKIGDRDASKTYEPYKFYRFSPDFLADVTTRTEAELRSYVQEFENQLFQTYYLGPLRENPQRYYEATGERPDDLGIKGQKIGAVLYADKDDNQEKIIKLTSKWLNELDIADSVSLSRIAKGNLFHLKIHGRNQKHDTNIIDYGFGVSQILPVIVESLYSPDNATLLIEQPEIHLNAHQQLELPNLFVELIKTSSKQFIIETHSEYFLKRLGTLVARQELSPEKVIVYYCHTDEEGSHMQPIKFDDLGVASWWPEQFLSEGFEGAAEHLEAMEARQEAA